MKLYRRKLIFMGVAIASVSSVTPVFAAVPRSLNLDQAVQYAVEHSPQFDSIKSKLAIAVADEKSAFYKFFPNLDLSATHGILDYDPRPTATSTSTSLPWTSSATLALTQNIFDNGESSANYKIAELSKQQAELNFVEQKNKLSLDVVTQFINYTLNDKLLEIQQKQIALMSKQYDSVSRDYYQGMKTKKDYLRFKTQLSRNQISLLSAENNKEKSRIELLRIIGVTTADATNEEFNFVPLTLDKTAWESAFPKLDIKNLYLYKYSQMQKKINELNYELVSRKTWPEWYLSAGATYSSSQYVNSGQSFSDNDSLSWTALLTLKYSFFDWGTRSRAQESAFLKNKIQTNELDVSLQILNSTFLQLESSARQTQSNLKLTKQLLTLEKDNLNFLQQEYRNGKVQYLDLITGYNNFSDAEVQFFTAAADLELLKYTVLYHQGKLYEELLK